jgi:RecB family exonuclease
MMSIEDINRLQRENNAEAERKRLAKVAQIQRDESKRKREAALLQEQQRIEQLALMKAEVKKSWLLSNYLMSEADFEAAWKNDKLQLMREHRVKMDSLPRM